MYDHVVAYDDLDSLPQGRAVYVDMAGDADVRGAVHGHYRDELAHSAVVGRHPPRSDGRRPRVAPGAAADVLLRARPGHQALRRLGSRRTGAAGSREAWGPYVEWTEGWLAVIHGEGPQALERAYLDLLDGRIDPATAHVLTLRS